MIDGFLREESYVLNSEKQITYLPAVPIAKKHDFLLNCQKNDWFENPFLKIDGFCWTHRTNCNIATVSYRYVYQCTCISVMTVVEFHIKAGEIQYDFQQMDPLKGFFDAL